MEQLKKEIEELKKRVSKLESGKSCKKTGVKKAKRKPSAYNIHIKSEMKKGKSMAEAAKSWSCKKK